MEFTLRSWAQPSLRITCGSSIPISLRRRYYILSYFKILLPFDFLHQWCYGCVITPSIHLSNSGPKDIPRIYHGSFPDFITDAERCLNGPKFYVLVGIQHARIAWNCLQAMGEQLRTNICNPEFPLRYLEFNYDFRRRDRILKWGNPQLSAVWIEWVNQ